MGFLDYLDNIETQIKKFLKEDVSVNRDIPGKIIIKSKKNIGMNSNNPSSKLTITKKDSFVKVEDIAQNHASLILEGIVDNEEEVGSSINSKSSNISKVANHASYLL
jgi:hypothetical protein